MRKWILAVVGLGMVTASAAQALCIDNRSDRAVAFVRGEPRPDMTEIYQDVVLARGFTCVPVPARADGIKPVSIYTITDRGRCKVAAGCFYENSDEVEVFVGTKSKNCTKPFSLTNCGTK
jgi:hypothetical protein